MEAIVNFPDAKEIYIKAIKENKEIGDPSVHASVMSLMKAQKDIDNNADDNTLDIKTDKIDIKPAGKKDGEITTDKDIKKAQDEIRQYHDIKEAV